MTVTERRGRARTQKRHWNPKKKWFSEFGAYTHVKESTSNKTSHIALTTAHRHTANTRNNNKRFYIFFFWQTRNNLSFSYTYTVHTWEIVKEFASFQIIQLTSSHTRYSNTLLSCLLRERLRYKIHSFFSSFSMLLLPCVYSVVCVSCVLILLLFRFGYASLNSAKQNLHQIK